MANIIGASQQTVGRIIPEDLFLRSSKKPKLQVLKPKHIESRKKNARKLSRDIVRQENYEFLVTLDESWLYLNNCNKGEPILYLKPGQDPSEDQLENSEQLGAKKLMAVGILTGRGPIPLIFVPTKAKINSEIDIDFVLRPLVYEFLL